MAGLSFGACARSDPAARIAISETSGTILFIFTSIFDRMEYIPRLRLWRRRVAQTSVCVVVRAEGTACRALHDKYLRDLLGFRASKNPRKKNTDRRVCY